MKIKVSPSEFYDPKGYTWQERAKKAEAQLDAVRDAIDTDPSYGSPHGKDCPCGRCKIVAILEDK